MDMFKKVFNKAADAQAAHQDEEKKVNKAMYHKDRAVKYRDDAANKVKEGDLDGSRSLLNSAEYHEKKSKEYLSDASPAAIATFTARQAKKAKEKKDKEDERINKKMEKDQKNMEKEAKKNGGTVPASKFVAKIKLKVPKGAKSGDTFKAKFNGQEIFIVCPPGVSGGKELLINLPNKDLEVAEAHVVEVADEKTTHAGLTPTTKEGWLEKTGMFNKAFKKRYFRLKDDSKLYYYENEESTKAKGNFDLANITMNTNPPRDNDKGFNYFILESKIAGGLSKRETKIYSEDSSVVKEWVTALKGHKVRYK